MLLKISRQHQACQHLHYWAPIREEREKRADNLLKTLISENIPNLGMKTDMQRVPRWSQKGSHQDITIIMVKIKINNLTISLRKATGYTQGNSHKAIGWLFSRNFSGHKEEHIVLKVLKEKTTTTTTITTTKTQPKILCLTSLPFKIVGLIGLQWKLKEFITTKPALQEMLKGLLQAKKKRTQLETGKLWGKNLY